jgi:Fe-S oxidoreductase
MSTERRIPPFAPVTFKEWFRRRGARNKDKPAVLLWPDTFNNYFLPHTAEAAVNVLEAAGFRVLLPKANLCCGRPLYDFGMLERAKSLLLEILDALSPALNSGLPVIGLEPSCVAVFRDELCNLFPRDDRARRLASHTFLLSEFLQKHASHFELPRFERKALLHGHCHHKSIMKMTDEEAVLHRMGIEFQSPAPGCCGMAGSFGFEKDKYQVSAAIGELELLPAIRKASSDCLIIADGFSCREQIAQGTERQALHLSEVIQMALHPETAPPEGIAPEAALMGNRRSAVEASMMRAAAGLAGVAITGALAWRSIVSH